MKPYRYPGPQPFSGQQQHIFFGRTKELDELLRLVRREQWLVLYGKSGLGKSSLLNAGLAPHLAKDDGMAPVFIRFHAWTESRKDTCLGIAIDLLKKDAAPPPKWLTQLVEKDLSLWRFLKARQIAQSGGDAKPSTLLIFDQFEELFTFPASAVEAFAKSLAEVFYTDIPERYRMALEKQPTLLSEAELRQLHEPLPLRVITAIRTDRMALMHQLKPFLPGTLDVCYELRPLSHAAAEEAVLNPAYDAGNFRTPRFDYADEALDTLLLFLSSGRKQDIESFQLQILCEHLEKNVVERAGRLRIAASDLADPAGILENYYLDKIGEIADPGSRLAARKLIEEGLIFEEEERRVTLFEGQIQRVWGVDAALLARLEDTHLLRREPSLRGGYTYELSHDTLVAPVLKAKAKRMAEESRAELEAVEARKAAELAALREQAEVEKRRAEAAEQLRNEAVAGRQRARTFAYLAALVAVVALGLGVFAFFKQRDASTASEKAKQEETKAKDALTQVEMEKKATETQRQKAEESAALAKQKAIEAEAANTLAQANLIRAKTEETRAKAALAQVEMEKSATEAQRQKAEENYRLAQDKTQEAEKQATTASLALAEQQKALAEIARRTVRDAQTQIYHLDYEGALATLQSAAALQAAQAEVSDALLEMVFFYAETGKFDRATGLLDTAAQLAGRDLTIPKTSGLTNLKDFHDAIKTLQPARFDSLLARYFPVMLSIPGGTDTLGSEEYDTERPRHAVTLSPFKMAKTETTWWQYYLFCEATGNEKPETANSWAGDGDNPVTNVSWYDAVEYANWLSEREGAEKAISKTGDEYAVQLHKVGYRLPTDAEWEYAARGGTDFEYAGSSEVDEVAWYASNSRFRTRPAGLKKANTYGLHDLSGNVWEWCWDWYGKNYYEQLRTSPKKDPPGPDSGSSRVLHGGSWNYDDDLCQVSFRSVSIPSNRGGSNGFRVVQGR